ncbi:protein G12-like [Colletes latitarsis]|uniref:protein G12-like n=1 Tax=Colletes latitarsis TaxID=2605962 RepID=UPI0040364960
MKFALSLLVVLAVASPLYAFKLPSSGSGALAKEFQDILDLIPDKKVLHLIRVYYTWDKEFQAAMKIVKGEESKEYIREVELNSKFSELILYIQNAGVDIYYLMNIINESLDLEPVVPFSLFRKKTGGIKGFIKDLADLLPLKEIEELVEDKRKNSPVFIDYVNEVISSKYHKLYDYMLSNEHKTNMMQQAEEAGIDGTIFNAYYFYFLMGVPFLK